MGTEIVTRAWVSYKIYCSCKTRRTQAKAVWHNAANGERTNNTVPSYCINCGKRNAYECYNNSNWKDI